MLEKKSVLFLTLSLFSVIGFGCSSGSSQETKGDGTEIKAESIENEESEEKPKKDIDEIEKEDMEQFINSHPNYEKYREKLDKLTDKEIIELLEKAKENKYQVTEDFTEDELLTLQTMTRYDELVLLGMTESEIYNMFDNFHNTINSRILSAYQEGGLESEEYEEIRSGILYFKLDFEWIRDNYNFEKEYHNELMKEIINLIEDHALGDNDALFSLKYIIYELNLEFNPESFDEERATHLTLSNAVRIQNGKNPIDEYQ